MSETSVTCYFRHMGRIFHKAGIEVTSKNKNEIDNLIHKIVGVEYRSCPSTWREVKKRIAENEEDFASRLRELYSKRM